ncbi:MAG: hypothetical protein QM765_00480 [Myxococcales bacterium]
MGESSVLAVAEVQGGIAVVDDQDAVQAAKEEGVPVLRSLGIISSGLKKGVFVEARAVEIIDALVKSGGARFPCDGAGFVAWAARYGLL